jgi:hypothetical protein
MATAKSKVRAPRPTTPRVNVVTELHPLASIARLEPSSVSAIAGRRGEFRCACGQRLRVFGLGRHRVYFEPGSAQLEDPLIAQTCPRCGRELPGSNPA